MAKQTGALKLIGTVDDLTFYRMEGKYYVRLKSTLTGKRFRRDAAFEGSRKSASRFAEGNRLASRVYKLIAEEQREYSLFCFLQRRSILLLKEGKSLEEAEALLRDYLCDFGLLPKARLKREGPNRSCIRRKSMDAEGGKKGALAGIHPTGIIPGKEWKNQRAERAFFRKGEIVIQVLKAFVAYCLNQSIPGSRHKPLHDATYEDTRQT